MKRPAEGHQSRRCSRPPNQRFRPPPSDPPAGGGSLTHADVGLKGPVVGLPTGRLDLGFKGTGYLKGHKKANSKKNDATNSCQLTNIYIKYIQNNYPGVFPCKNCNSPPPQKKTPTHTKKKPQGAVASTHVTSLAKHPIPRGGV